MNKGLGILSAGLAGALVMAVAAGVGTGRAAGVEAAALPEPAGDIAAGTSAPGLQTAIFAGGCFWGVQAVFQHIDGVTQALSGYSGGPGANPDYRSVSSGGTGHAEAVRVTFDPARVSYGTLLQIFFSVALDPTQVNRQGPDSGTQYRSVLFVDGPEQERVARSYLAQLTAAHVYSKPIATRVDAVAPFHVAEAYHQNYLVQHPTQPYIAMHDMPKVEALQRLFPQYWLAAPALVGS